MLDLEKFLNPETIKRNLLLSSLYLSAYELLKSAIIDNIKDFFVTGYMDGKPIVDKRYNEEVTKVYNDLLHASCLWLVKMGVITDGEAEEIERIRSHRNQVAHELPKLLSQSDLNLNLEYFVRIKELLEKIDIWWIKNVDIPITNPELVSTLDETEIIPSRVIMLHFMVSGAFPELKENDDNRGKHP